MKLFRITIIAAGAVARGVGFNMQTKSAVEESESISSQYAGSGSNNNYDS